MRTFINVCEKLRDLPPLFFRLILAYGFFQPALKKLTHFGDIVAWFESMNYFMPLVNAVLATAAESLGVVLLALGLGTRLISIPLMVVMVVATWTVHWDKGFTTNDGYEIPVYYFLMLFSLMVTGPGRLSLDHFLNRSFRK